MSWTLCTYGEALAKAGRNSISGANISGAMVDGWSNQAEGAICANTRYDWVVNYASVGTNFVPILADTASDLIGMKIINYDMSGFTSRVEAQTMLDVLRDNIIRNLETLKDQKNKEKMGV